MVIIFGFSSAFSPNLPLYAVMRFLIGFFIPIASAQKIVLASEFVDTNHRPFFVLPIGIAFGCSACLLGLLAYYVRTWKNLVIACTAPFSVTILFYWYVILSLFIYFLFQFTPRYILSKLIFLRPNLELKVVYI